MDGGSRVLASDRNGRVRDVELRDESGESGSGAVDQSADRGVVETIVRDGLTGSRPAELQLISRLGERRAVVGDSRLVAVLQEVGLVGDGQPREDGELDARVLARARGDVSREQGPRHGLRDTALEPDGHGVRAGELAEDHLLSRLGGDGLEKELRGGSRVEVREEAVHSGLSPGGQHGSSGGGKYAPSGEPLAEVDKVSDGVKVVLVLALLRGGSAAVVDDVGQERGVADLLVGHELDQRDVIGSETGLGEVLGGESGDTVVEQVELDPLLVESHDERLVVDCS